MQDKELTQLQNDVSKLKTDVALLKQSNEKVVEPALREIRDTLRSFTFVTTSEFEEYRDEVDKRFLQVQRQRWIQNTLSALAGAVLVMLADYAIRDMLGK